MKYPATTRLAAWLLAGLACAGSAVAQQGSTVLKDTEPLPPEDRSSVGAVIMTNDPVLAQREQMTRLAQERNPTSMMGAGPAVIQRKERTKSELEAQRLREVFELHQRGAGGLIEK
jgi:hypothetical protein